jgi:hypothetical protein
VRRVLLTGRCTVAQDGGDAGMTSDAEQLARLLEEGRLSAQELLGRYCALLYRRFGTYAEVAARSGLDRRTARKYVVEYGTPAEREETPRG